MASTRLTQDMRMALTKMVDEKVHLPVLESAEQEARKELFAVFEAHLVARFNQTDMQVLKKYQLAHHFTPDDNCKIHLYDGRLIGFTGWSNPQYCPAYGKQDTPPQWAPYTSECLVPSQRSYENRIDFVFTDAEVKGRGREFTKLYDAWDKARLKVCAEIAKVRKDFMDLIQNSRTFEQVEAVWPEAAVLRPRIIKNLPTVVLDATIERINYHRKRQKREETRVGGDD